MKGLDGACMDISVNSNTRDTSISVPLYLDKGKLRANKIRVVDYPKMSQPENTVTSFLDDQAIGEIRGIWELWDCKGDIVELNLSHSGHGTQALCIAALSWYGDFPIPALCRFMSCITVVPCP